MQKFGLMISCCFFIPSAFARDHTQIPIKVQSFIASLDNEKQNLQGGAIAVLYRGEVVYKSAFGYRKGKIGAINSQTLFPLASVSKPVSAMAIALLVESGIISLDHKLQSPYLRREINLTHILSHTTGYHFTGNLQIERGMSRTKLLEQLKYHPPSCSPGECYRYSNTTFSLVEELLNTKQLSLDNAIQNLQISLKTDGIQTVPIHPEIEVAHPHAKSKNRRSRQQVPLPFPPYYPKATPAAAGIFASLDGMIAVFKLSFGYRPDLISKDTLNKFYTPIISNRDIEKWSMVKMDRPYNKKKIRSYYGLGWRILKTTDQHNKDLIYHSGYISGIRTFIGFVPAEEVGIIFLVNQNSNVPLKNGIALWSKYLN